MIKKILMIDDDADDRELFQLVIQTINPAIETSFAQNGDDALKQLIASSKPDVVFLDLHMPGMDGIECLTKIKHIKSLREIPIIIYSSSQDKQDNELAIRLGAAQLLPKSIHFDQLCESIGHIVSLPDQSTNN